MTRIGMLALATALIVGSLSTAVEAAHHGGGGSHGASHANRAGGSGHSSSARRSGGFSSGRVFGGHRGVHFSRGYRFYRHYSYSSCYRWRRVWTSYGWQLRRVNVCYPRRYPLYRFGF